MYSFGEYSAWDRESKAIPKILNFTTEIEAKIGTEFGYVLRIKQGKGELLTFRIDHPPFKDENGRLYRFAENQAYKLSYFFISFAQGSSCATKGF